MRGGWLAAVLLAGAATGQWVEAVPSVVEAGQPVVIEVRGAERAPIVGVAVAARDEAGRVVGFGRTDAEGRIRVPAPEVGSWLIRAELDGVPLLAPLHVEPRGPRGLLGVLGAALAVGFAVVAWRRWRAPA